MTATTNFSNSSYADIVIIGGGPVGLSFASAMVGLDVKVLIVEKSNLASIAKPEADGREIALTHLSVKILKRLGVWDLLPKETISLIKQAKVFNGAAADCLNFKPSNKIDALGYLLPNYQIRSALYQRISAADNISFMPDTCVYNVQNFADGAEVLLENKKRIKAKLVVAADSRFSSIRRKMGISSISKDFSKVMVITQMQHPKPHHHIALEYFDYKKTLALLPMNGNASSLVMTVPHNQAQKFMNMNDAEFNAQASSFFKNELGPMTQIGKRYSYPLVGVHAQSFIAERFALIGDAAVAMHPVTAHGFNLGLKGQDILADLVKNALSTEQDIGGKSLLSSFEKKHIHLTRLLFFSTNGIVALFTNDALLVKPLRRFALKFAENFPPIKYLITRHLTAVKSDFPTFWR